MRNRINIIAANNSAPPAIRSPSPQLRQSSGGSTPFVLLVPTGTGVAVLVGSGGTVGMGVLVGVTVTVGEAVGVTVPVGEGVGEGSITVIGVNASNAPVATSVALTVTVLAVRLVGR